ncbi:MAG: hypothetical protein ACTSUX_06115 [Promethearchaeota archaeon]
MIRARFREIQEFMKNNDIPEMDKNDTIKLELLDHIFLKLYEKYRNDSLLHYKHGMLLNYLAHTILRDEKLKDYLTRFDFISRKELMDIFADYCADFGISVYDASSIEDHSMDLYLIKKKPILRTEAVFVLTGFEMDENRYMKLLDSIKKAGQIASWTVFVTTPRGIYKIGLNRIIKDMEALKTWLYVVDPIHHKILGITKGKKVKSHDVNLRNEFVNNLPRESIRAPSLLSKISKYSFSEKDSYNPKNFIMFEYTPRGRLVMKDHLVRVKPKYKDIFRSLMIIDKVSGLAIFSLSSEDNDIDDGLVSGFLSAMDSFVGELSGNSSMNEINYKGFHIHATYGEHVKLALFLSKPADQSLKERLKYFLKQFEEHYHDQILEFKKSGNSSIFEEKKLNPIIREILSI